MCEYSTEMQANFRDLSLFINGLTKQNQDSLIPILHEAQNIFGYLPEIVQDFIAERLEIPKATVYGVVSFYSYFATEPKGKYQINVCMGTACFVKGAAGIMTEFERRLNIKNGETTTDLKYSLGSLRCVGACGLAPVVLVNDKVYGNCTSQIVNKILTECDKEEG